MEAKVEQMVEVIRQQITSAQTARNAPSQAAPFSQTFPNIPEQIKQLAALRDAGILTKEEFEQKKA